ncbi:MAG TPA: HAD family hydrolase [Frankiaceae bacterium]|nr:HAD family hydrolase [Frankiaceae bacterium]
MSVIPPAAPKVVASDLDGTLVDSEGHISARTRRALDQARDMGALLIFVTGRPPRWMSQVVAETGASGLAVCANGAMVYDLGSGEVIRQHVLDPASAERLVEAIRAELPGVTFAVESGVGFAHEPDYVPTWPAPRDAVAEVAVLLQDPVAKLLVKHPERGPDEIHEIVAGIAGADANVTYSGNVLLEVSAAGISKASTLEALCIEYGVGQAEVIAFGDMPNDVPMLAWAGYAVAVANAHPSVMAIADEVTASNDDDGVAQVLERLYK